MRTADRIGMAERHAAGAPDLLNRVVLRTYGNVPNDQIKAASVTFPMVVYTKGLSATRWTRKLCRMGVSESQWKVIVVERLASPSFGIHGSLHGHHEWKIR